MKQYWNLVKSPQVSSHKLAMIESNLSFTEQG